MNTADEVRQFTVAPDDDGIRVDRWFKRHLPQIGFGTVSKWARTGKIRVDGAFPINSFIAAAKAALSPGGTSRPSTPLRNISEGPDGQS